MVVPLKVLLKPSFCLIFLASFHHVTPECPQETPNFLFFKFLSLPIYFLDPIFTPIKSFHGSSSLVISPVSHPLPGL